MTFGYDSQGHLLSTKDTIGQTVSYSYDTNGNLSSTTDVLGHIITYSYNARGNILSNSQQNGTHTLRNHFTYDDQGRKLTYTDTLGNTTTFTFNSLGQKTTITDPLGRVTRMVYDADGRMIETILPDATPSDLTDNPRIKTEYDEMGREIAQIDAAGGVTRMVYDSVGRVIEIIEPDTTPNDLTDNPRIKTEYYSDGLVKASIDELGHRTEYRYDALGRQIAIIYADSTPNDLSDNPTSRTVYDAVGEVIQSIDALGRVTKYIYDELGRITTTKFADGSQNSTEYDKLGRKIAAVDQNGNQTKYQYDGLGRLIEVKNSLQDTTAYNYDEIGRLLSMTDAEGRSTSYEYDDLGRRTATILPLGQRSSSSYDRMGHLITSTDFNNRTTTFSYDAQNRVTDKLFQDGSKVSYSYTVDGLLDITTMFSSNGQVTAVYDQDYDVRNQLIKRTDTVNGVSLAVSNTYDLAGNRTSVSTPNNITYYTYDERNRLKAVTDNVGGVTAYNYDANNNLTQTVFANGVVESRTYDLLNRLSDLVNKKGNGTILSGYHYTLDKVGNRVKVAEDNGRTVDYTYDKLYRLVSEAVTDLVHGNQLSGFSYDKVGNRLTQTQNAVTTVYNYDNNDRLLTEKVNGQAVVNYTYDNNGSTLSKIEVNKLTLYTWNDDKRLVAATITDPNGVQQLGYQYDDNGIRVSSSVGSQVTRYLLDTLQAFAQVLSEYQSNSSTPSVSYVYGNDLISQTRASHTDYYLVDGLGSTRVLTDNQGNVTNTYDYEAFGKLLNSSGGEANSYLFAGEQFDGGLGDYYNRDRFYDSDTGRFSRRDDWEGNRNMPDTLHKYIYGTNNPVIYTDPSGFGNTITGQDIHDQIADYFIVFNPQTLPGQGRIASQNLQIKTIWQLHLGINPKNIPTQVVWTSLRNKKPDLVDFDAREFYEIGTIKQRNEKIDKINNTYLPAMNKALQHLRRNNEIWSGGSTFIAPPILRASSTGTWVLVLPPSQGVISYQEIFGDDGLFWFTITTIIALEYQRLIAQTQEAVALATISRGLAL
jgi:RHS repeat-associated protein